MDIKVLIATHKKYWMPRDSMYLPIQVGAALNKSLGYITDNEGDNISAKNPFYSELTGLYWAWKNLDCNYLGLFHYRRYLGHKSKWYLLSGTLQRKYMILKDEECTSLLAKYDIILPKKRNYYVETIKSHYAHAHNLKDLESTEQIIAEKYPEYLNAFDAVMSEKELYILNMCITKKEIFDAYCEWLFSILFELENRIDYMSYDVYQKRVFGFLSERLFNVWLRKQNLSKVELDVIEIEPVNWSHKIYNFLKRKLKG
ncbi:DUF4422 domain-containing protein [Veillonella seminalis]|uniref:DUF4422 domain-containing protein n=1 Tax=Veillonella seminalis ACS-216-V-Col6b TaxID=883156 RepID=K9DPS2_9FIRM|nr:DUF4422 domain-containing protein [Veillonella seminalis]EKU79340.1 hypothetical protein HMPREF9282_00148 [Veillonella seminalis ACS-216-V-Col6b]